MCQVYWAPDKDVGFHNTITYLLPLSLIEPLLFFLLSLFCYWLSGVIGSCSKNRQPTKSFKMTTMDQTAYNYDGLVTYEDDRKVPCAKYIEDVEMLVGDKNPLAITNNAKELLAKYRFMEKTMVSKLTALNNKVPELKDAVTILEKIVNSDQSGQGGIYTYFKVSDTLFCQAQIPSTKDVFLWLGANTMVEYPVDEATELLKEQMKVATDSIEEIKNDLDWVRSQITSMEVTVARLHNFTVMKNGKAGSTAAS